MTTALRNLSSCGCCKGTAVETPGRIWNRPGLSAIAYRVGTHPEFKATMLARLSAGGLHALDGLRTRDDSDFSIAFLDAFASVADVLTFYQERIAQESYLRTATERRSVLELARLLGYELDPGLAASVYLAFTIDDAPGAFGRALSVASTATTAPEEPQTVTIPVGTQVQTVPGPDESPQIFETVEEIDARSEWNEMQPRQTTTPTLTLGMEQMYLSGAVQTLTKGDRLLVVVGSDHELRTVQDTKADSDNKRTLVKLEKPSSKSSTVTSVIGKGSASSITSKTLDQKTIKQIKQLSWSAEELRFLVLSKGWNANTFATAMSGTSEEESKSKDGVFVFRQLAAIFGYNAPWIDSTTSPPKAAAWNDYTLEKYAGASTSGKAKRYIFFDRVYGEVLPDSWLVLQAPGAKSRYLKIDAVESVARTQNMVSGKCTRLTIETETLNDFKIRSTTVLVQGEKLPSLGPEPIKKTVERNDILLDDYYGDLARGQTIAVTGTPNDLQSVVESEIGTIESVSVEQGLTRLTLDADLAKDYVRTSVTINANVAFATHGESVSEVLGSGDATLAFQQFKIQRPRLTWVGAENETGSESTLKVYVNDVEWEEVAELFGHGPEERVYTIRMDDDGNSYVVFGDGETGARLPTGENNVTAVYRRGIGTDGDARASQITQLMNKPVGVKGATNPLAADVGGDWETLADARTNANLTALALGRVVSLRDYEDFARAYPGIAKASATWSWSGQRRRILLTLAGDDEKGVESDGDLAKRLAKSIKKLGDPYVKLKLVPYDPLIFYLKAKIKIDPAYQRDKVFAAIRNALSDAFSFDARSFGQAVSRGEVMSVIHGVDGVVAIDLDEFYSSDGSATDDVARISAEPATKNGPARLLTLDTTNEVPLEVMS